MKTSNGIPSLPRTLYCNSCGKSTLTLAKVDLDAFDAHLCERCLSNALDDLRGAANCGNVEIAPLSFTKETARIALEAARASLAYVALRDCEQLVGDILWGGSALTDERVEARMRDIALAWEKRGDLADIARRAAVSPYDDVSALVTEANDVLARTTFAEGTFVGARVKTLFAHVREALARDAKMIWKAQFRDLPKKTAAAATSGERSKPQASTSSSSGGQAYSPYGYAYGEIEKQSPRVAKLLDLAFFTRVAMQRLTADDRKDLESLTVADVELLERLAPSYSWMGTARTALDALDTLRSAK